MTEASFYSFMGFDPAFARRARAFYVPFFEGCAEVLELACGRGEFLEVLAEAKIPGLGVDEDEDMIAVAKGAGARVERGDAFEFLAGRPSAFDGIFSAHFIEHLPYERAAELLRLCFASLRPGGRVVVCTPNSASLPTLQHQFWWEPTHVRLYDIELLRFMLAETGFTEIEAGENPENHPGCPVDLEALDVAPIGPLPTAADPASRFGQVRRRLADALLRGRVDNLLRRTEALDQRGQSDHHHLTVVAASLKELLSQLYVSSEIYVKGRKPE